MQQMKISHALFARLKLCLFALVITSCAGCGFLFGDEGMFRDRSQDYKKAPEVPPVALPQGTQSDTLREIYVIPEVRDSLILEGDFEVPQPTPLVAGAGTEVVRIQKLGDQSWALVGVPPGQVWPQVRSFMNAAGMQVARADARAGILESGWLTLKEQPLPSRFQFRMEQGVQRATSELHVKQMSRAGNEREWPAVSDSQTQAQEMLQAVAQFLADSADSAPVSMIAEQGISAGGKISLQEAPQGHTYISLGLPFDRAWASLARALERSAFAITDRDRSVGTYYARFDGPSEEEEEAGWMDWLWSGDDEHPLAGQSFVVEMARENEQSVTIQLRPQEQDIEIEKRQEQGLLSLIKGNIN